MHALRALRLSREQTQEAFAASIGWSDEALQRVETGKLRAGDLLIVRLAKAENLTLEQARKLADGEALDAPGGAEREHASDAVRDAG